SPGWKWARSFAATGLASTYRTIAGTGGQWARRCVCVCVCAQNTLATLPQNSLPPLTAAPMPPPLHPYPSIPAMPRHATDCAVRINGQTTAGSPDGDLIGFALPLRGPLLLGM
ncbi:hypothetical protein Vretimale_18402, partial [Volvox reticuliferus]